MPKRCCARPTASWRARTAPGSSTPPPITTEMRRTSFRPERVGELIRQTIAAFLTGAVRDPRIGFVTVTGVGVSADLSHAAVRVSGMGSDEEKARSLEGLASAAGFLRARRGEPVELPERDVEFRALALVAFAPSLPRSLAAGSPGTCRRSIPPDGA